MGGSATKLLVKVGLGIVALTFTFLLLDVEGDGNWALGITLIWILVGVATLILLTRRRHYGPRRRRRGSMYLKTLEFRQPRPRQPHHLGDEQAAPKYLTQSGD